MFHLVIESYKTSKEVVLPLDVSIGLKVLDLKCLYSQNELLDTDHLNEANKHDDELPFILEDTQYSVYQDTSSLSLLGGLTPESSQSTKRYHNGSYHRSLQWGSTPSQLPFSNPNSNMPNMANSGLAGRFHHRQLPPQRTNVLLLLAVPVAVPPSLLYYMLNLSKNDSNKNASSSIIDPQKVLQVRILKRKKWKHCLDESTKQPNFDMDFYSVLFVFASQKHADDFYWRVHGAFFDTLYSKLKKTDPFLPCSKDSSEKLLSIQAPFRSTSTIIRQSLFGCCYFIHISTISYFPTRSAGSKQECFQFQAPVGVPESVCSAVPVCPVCLERVDNSVFGVVTRSDGWSDVQPETSKCLVSCETCCNIVHGRERLTMQVSRTHVDGNASEDQLPPVLCLFSQKDCESCADLSESWICLICGHLGCGRYKQKHAKEHALQYHHRICLQVSTGHVWDYQADVFVHRRIVHSATVSGLFRVIGLPHPATSEQTIALTSRLPSDISLEDCTPPVANKRKRRVQPETTGSRPTYREKIPLVPFSSHRNERKKGLYYVRFGSVNRSRRKGDSSAGLLLSGQHYTSDHWCEPESSDTSSNAANFAKSDDEVHRRRGISYHQETDTDDLDEFPPFDSWESDNIKEEKFWSGKVKKHNNDPMDEYCKELEVILASQLDFQRILYGQKVRECEAKHWSKLQDLLLEGERLQEEADEFKQKTRNMKERTILLTGATTKLEKRLNEKTVEISELKAINEVLLSNMHVGESLSSCDEEEAIKSSSVECEHRARMLELDMKIGELETEVLGELTS